MDNLKTLQQLTDDYINPNGAPGSILAENHNSLVKELLAKLGKYTGQPYLAHKSVDTFVPGTMSWESNAMNVQSVFKIKFSKLSADLTDFERVLQLYRQGDIVKFKDYVGRSVFLEFQSYISGQDPSGNDIYILDVKGFAENLNYTYQAAESEIAVFEFYSQSPKSKIVFIEEGGVASEFDYRPVKGNAGLEFVTGDAACNGWTEQNEFGTFIYYNGPAGVSTKTVTPISDWFVKNRA